ncbi:MAG TPA: choice-of-anchor tandem repeat GloVer-containing protein [Terriglobales bacterium]|jgi:uncharacterized repeat protein (TIGR03803 family)|nr:choice-of-anchor tandem repeat GloVer-containing protein [Terriglobales bacterium]
MWRHRQLEVLCTILVLLMTSAAWAKNKYQTLYKFTGATDGGQPFGGLIFDQVGNMYGTTVSGGVYNNGTVFQLTPNSSGTWTEHVLYNFCSLTNCADGSDPYDSLILDAKGNMYGTTDYGGAYGGGEVFQLTPNGSGDWTESVLYSFSGADGSYPIGGVIFDAKGNLYGTTDGGGDKGAGVVFKLAKNSAGDWTESLLYSFCSVDNCRDGGYSSATLAFDQSGNLYGTTEEGGDPNCGNAGCGVVFQLTPERNRSWVERVLHTFTGYPDGAYPYASVTLDKNGDLLGTTASGGTASGTVFKLTRKSKGSWRETLLITFNEKGGENPDAGITLDTKGNLYGATLGGGDFNCAINGCGVAFKLVPNSKGGWNERVLHEFSDHPGIFPVGGLTLDTAGNLYGTTAGDNVKSHGSVYKLTP